MALGLNHLCLANIGKQASDNRAKISAMKHMLLCASLFLVLNVLGQSEFDVGTDYKDPHSDVYSTAKPARYLLYDVNPGEGFNLRRDVYIRMANLVKMLIDDGGRWILVLPAWGRIYHWKSPFKQERLPWSRFFDIESLRMHVPVIEVEEWIQISDPSRIDEMYYLQSYAEGWINGKWSERWDKKPCTSKHGYIQDRMDGEYHGWFWGFDDVTAKKFSCLSVQAEITSFKKFMNETKGRSVMLHRAESLIHGHLSEWSKEWWTARRSMRFSKRLVSIADKFRSDYLQSNDEDDKTVRHDDWRDQEKELGSAVGGPYLAVHMRRRDFIYGHHEKVPSLKFAAEQLKKKLEGFDLKILFVATDAPREEMEEFRGYMSDYSVHRFIPDEKLLKEIGDGGWTIVDQWIAAHGRYFIGTSTSTVSFRINEERALLGFAPDMTYNRMCGDKESKEDCAKNQPGRWFPNYGKS